LLEKDLNVKLVRLKNFLHLFTFELYLVQDSGSLVESNLSSYRTKDIELHTP
jgi:hypothetical protein